MTLREEIEYLKRTKCCGKPIFKDTFAEFPTEGKLDTLYVDKATGTIYLWDGDTYEVVGGQEVGDIVTNVKVLLRGPTTVSTMTNTLATSLLIPLNEPYEGLDYIRYNFRGETVSSTSVFTTNTITDWILVELRDKNNPHQVAYNRAGLLKNNGEIFDVDGVTKLTFTNVVIDDYFLSVKHRNHLGVMTKVAIDCTTLVDFTNPSTLTWGTGAQTLLGSVNVLTAGKFSPLGYATYIGRFGWESAVYTQYPIYFTDLSFINSGYIVYDVNLNGEFKMNGSGNDRLIVQTAIGFSSNRSSIKYEQIPCEELSKFKPLLQGEFSTLVTSPTTSTTLGKITDSRPDGGKSFDESFQNFKSGIILPKGTTAERAIVSSGLIRYNTTDNKVEYHNGTTWIQL